MVTYIECHHVKTALRFRKAFESAEFVCQFFLDVCGNSFSQRIEIHVDFVAWRIQYYLSPFVNKRNRNTVVYRFVHRIIMYRCAELLIGILLRFCDKRRTRKSYQRRLGQHVSHIVKHTAVFATVRFVY